MADYSDVKEALRAVDKITNSRDLAQFESVLDNDPFADGPEWQRVRDALALREREIRQSESEANRAVRQDEHRSMMDALASVSTKGSGTNIRQAVRGGRRVPVTGNGFDVPASGSGDSDGNDPYRAGLSLFLERYIRPNLSEGYVTRSPGGRGMVQGGGELLDKEGVVPPDAGRAGLNEFLMHMAEDGTLDAAGVDAFAKEKGLSASAASRARGAARKTARADAGPSQAKAKNTLQKSIKAGVLKDTAARMKSLYQMGYLNGKRDAGAYTGAVQGDGLAGMPQDGSGGGNGGSEGGGGNGSGGNAKNDDGGGNGPNDPSAPNDPPNDPPSKPKKPKKSGAVGNGFEPFMAARLFDNFSASVRAGLQVGNAAGAVASGIEHMVLGAAGAFVHAGESALGLFLSPFGRTGGSLARMAGAIGGALVSGLTAGGGLAVAGIKLGVGLVGGLIAGVQSLGGAAIGAVLGAAGGPAGMLAGAVIGSGLVARIQSVFSGVLTTIGGAVGQALASIGTAFGELGNAVGGFLSSVKDVLSDLIETGVRLGQTALGVQRQSGMSGQASSDAVGLSQVLTGGPGAFSGLFSNVAMMTPYMRARDTAYGVKAGNSFVDNLPALFKRYQAFGDGPAGALQRRIMLSVVAPGAQDTIGGLFSLGGGAVQKAVLAAKQVALTPAENRQNAMLGFDLSVAQAQIDRLKTKLLTDLMPALNGILGVFTKWFTGHEGAIVGSLEKFGRWIYVMLPEYFRQGTNAFLKMGMAIGDALPGIALFIDKFYFGFATLFNMLQKGLGGLMISVAPLVALIPVVGTSAAAALVKQGAGMLTSPGLDPTAMDGMFNDKDGVFGKNGALNGDNIKKWSQDHKYGFDQDFEKNEGSINTRNKAYDGFSQYFNNNRAGAAGSADINIKGEFVVRPDEESFSRFERRVGDQTMKRLVRADQRS